MKYMLLIELRRMQPLGDDRGRSVFVPAQLGMAMEVASQRDGALAARAEHLWPVDFVVTHGRPLALSNVNDHAAGARAGVARVFRRGSDGTIAHLLTSARRRSLFPSPSRAPVGSRTRPVRCLLAVRNRPPRARSEVAIAGCRRPDEVPAVPAR